TKSCGGSDSPAILGESPYATQFSVWADKTAPPLVTESTERQQIGLGLEEFVCQLYQQKYGGQVERWPSWTIARHPERSYIHATPDATVFDSEHDGPGSLSIKTWSEFDQASWRDAPPLSVQIQLQQELAVLGWDWGVVAVLFSSQRLERFHFERDDRFIQALLRCLEEFWVYVVDRVEPPIDQSIATARALERLHPDDNGLAVELPAEATELLDSLASTKEVAKSCETRRKSIENQLKSWIGDATYGITPDGRCVSWKSQTRKAYQVAESTSRVLRADVKPPKVIEYTEQQPQLTDGVNA
ncbi:MAG: YqaJ viral recombinase family protein, partial [Planctomycetales bacterium]|nr:YqaJ viral recombinase family protein [Planctomycetales bacterium]